MCSRLFSFCKAHARLAFVRHSASRSSSSCSFLFSAHTSSALTGAPLLEPGSTLADVCSSWVVLGARTLLHTPEESVRGGRFRACFSRVGFEVLLGCEPGLTGLTGREGKRPLIQGEATNRRRGRTRLLSRRPEACFLPGVLKILVPYHTQIIVSMNWDFLQATCCLHPSG